MHTNKLKRKLADLGLEASSPKLSESFCLIGTPLPPLEKSKDTGEFVPLWKQDVRDEKGRRRLHGAFTGGFSAGYYNTVGSAEGWTPATFVSSRADRASKKQTRPEDFMDEEDLAELRDSQKLVDTTEEADLFSSTQQQDSVSDALQKLIPPSRDSIGSRLLRKMGWKPGQGVGPKISYRQLKQQEAQLRSISGRPSQATDDVEDEEASKHMYPPRDTPLILYQRKENTFGVGYTPGARLEDTSAKSDRVGSGPRLSAGFGLGALNDAEDDDIDVYDLSGADRSRHRHLAFDESEATDDLDRSQNASRVHRKPNAASMKPSAQQELFNSGAPVLLGFALSKLSVIDDQWFEAPNPPNGWEPDPRRVWSETADESQRPKALTDGSSAQLRRMTADERGAVLGETPLPSAPRSVFDYLTPKDRERLRGLAASSLTTLETADPGGNEQPTEYADTTAHSIPRIDHAVAKAALTGFQPFHTDPAKAARYTAYLKSQAGPNDAPLRPSQGQPLDAFYRELREFATSAKIFKPAAGVLGGRFATAKVVEKLGGGKEGLYVPATGEEFVDEANKPPEIEKKEDPKINAAKLGMFGPLTRSVQEWDPAKLLLKRFGVKEPIREINMETEIHANKEDEWKTQMPADPQSSLDCGQSVQESETIKAATASFRARGNDLSNIGLGEDEDQGRDTLTYVKPERDIFKAIFESDDEEEEDNDERDKLTMPVDEPTPDEEMPAPQIVTNESDKLAATASTNYVPSAASGPAAHVDMSSFRPTFQIKGKEKEGQKDKKKTKEKDRRRGKAILSFGDEEDGGLVLPEKRKHKKSKKEKHVSATHEDDMEMWVEKDPAEAVVESVHSEAGITIEDGGVNQNTAIQSGGRRMKAVDFL